MKNEQAKTRELENPYEIWRNDSGWEWRVLKKWQVDDDKPFARWFCAVKSPFTYGSYEYGDTYVSDIKEYGYKVEEDKNGN
jgi:hypothetical protein